MTARSVADPAALHGQFLEIFASNSLCRPGAMTVLGSPIDLSRISLLKFVTGALTDHLTPWKGCYQTTQLIGGPATFVLSNAGHIASLVNPPGNPKASYYTGGAPGPDPEVWLASATQHTGSWWEGMGGLDHKAVGHPEARAGAAWESETQTGWPGAGPVRPRPGANLTSAARVNKTRGGQAANFFVTSDSERASNEAA